MLESAGTIAARPKSNRKHCFTMPHMTQYELVQHQHHHESEVYLTCDVIHHYDAVGASIIR